MTYVGVVEVAREGVAVRDARDELSGLVCGTLAGARERPNRFERLPTCCASRFPAPTSMQKPFLLRMGCSVSTSNLTMRACVMLLPVIHAQPNRLCA